MKKVMVWFLLSCKRYIKKLSFLLILLLLPLVILAVDKGQGDKGQEIKIAIAVQNGQENELGAELAEGLINRRLGRDAGMFRFYECRDEEAVKDEVASRRAECGFVVYEDFKEKLDAGNYRRSIGVYSAPSTVSASLSTETVFAALMEIYDRQLLMDYVGEESLFEQLGAPGSAQREQAAAQSGELYDKWLANGSTFRFEYSFLDQEGREQTSSDALSGTVFPVRGLVAVYVFITGLYGAVVLCGDEERGLYLPLSYGLRTPCRLASMAAPVFLASISGLMALWAGRSLGAPAKEIIVMAVYCGAVTAVSWLLKLACRRPQVLCCIIPFFVIGSLLFCPVFIDAGRYLDVFDQVGKMFPPWYYPHMFR